jgi:hypothetical protein
MMSRSREEQHEVRLQCGQDARINVQRLDLGCSVRTEADVVEAAKGGGIFVLLAHVAFQAEASDAEGSFCEIVL